MVPVKMTAAKETVRMMRLTFWEVPALACAWASAVAVVLIVLVDEVGGGGRDGDGDEDENGRDVVAGLAVGARLAAARVVAVTAVLLSGCSMAAS